MSPESKPTEIVENIMKKQSGKSTANTAYNQTLPTPISYGFDWEDFETADEVRAANEWPKDADVVKYINTDRKANARQKALQAALDAAGIIKPTLETDEQLRLREMFKVLMSSKRYTEDQAKDMAAQTLGLTWAQ
jgi:hypothetical protein